MLNWFSRNRGAYQRKEALRVLLEDLRQHLSYQEIIRMIDDLFEKTDDIRDDAVNTTRRAKLPRILNFLRLLKDEQIRYRHELDEPRHGSQREGARDQRRGNDEPRMSWLNRSPTGGESAISLLVSWLGDNYEAYAVANGEGRQQLLQPLCDRMHRAGHELCTIKKIRSQISNLRLEAARAAAAGPSNHHCPPRLQSNYEFFMDLFGHLNTRSAGSDDSVEDEDMERTETEVEMSESDDDSDDADATEIEDAAAASQPHPDGTEMNAVESERGLIIGNTMEDDEVPTTDNCRDQHDLAPRADPHTHTSYILKLERSQINGGLATVTVDSQVRPEVATVDATVVGSSAKSPILIMSDSELENRHEPSSNVSPPGPSGENVPSGDDLEHRIHAVSSRKKLTDASVSEDDIDTLLPKPEYNSIYRLARADIDVRTEVGISRAKLQVAGVLATEVDQLLPLPDKESDGYRLTLQDIGKRVQLGIGRQRLRGQGILDGEIDAFVPLPGMMRQS